MYKYKVTKNEGIREDKVLKTVAKRSFRFTLEKYLTDDRNTFHISQHERATLNVILILTCEEIN